MRFITILILNLFFLGSFAQSEEIQEDNDQDSLAVSNQKSLLIMPINEDVMKAANPFGQKRKGRLVRTKTTKKVKKGSKTKTVKITKKRRTKGHMHEGIDFICPSGSNVFAAADGVVTEVERGRMYGNLVTIRHNDELKTRYAHLKDFQVHIGDTVKQGQVIAHVGRTGNATCYHLHFEVIKGKYKVNPAKYFFVDFSRHNY